jgi:mannose-6-phosphate isomerase-like protein (cupin superfamily)
MVHHTQNEVFHVIEGAVTWRVGDDDVECGFLTHTA